MGWGYQEFPSRNRNLSIHASCLSRLCPRHDDNQLKSLDKSTCFVRAYAHHHHQPKNILANVAMETDKPTQQSILLKNVARASRQQHRRGREAIATCTQDRGENTQRGTPGDREGRQQAVGWKGREVEGEVSLSGWKGFSVGEKGLSGLRSPISGAPAPEMGSPRLGSFSLGRNSSGVGGRGAGGNQGDERGPPPLSSRWLPLPPYNLHLSSRSNNRTRIVN